MPEKDGLQVITDLMSHGEPKPRIIVMTTYESEGDVRRVLKADIWSSKYCSLEIQGAYGG
jgi:DNA-binding NarL/FixJ family response regulator